MPLDFLSTDSLTEDTSIDLINHLVSITTPIHDRAIDTTYVRQGSGRSPILLLHGFDSSILLSNIA